MKNFLAIIQARTGSTRLPNKVMKPLGGITIIKRCYNSIKNAIGEAIVAIPSNDKTLIDYLSSEHIPFFMGDETDVLKRFYDCAITYEAQNIGRITADCWCHNPFIIRGITSEFLNSGFDFATNRLKPYTYPEGWDYECMSARCLSWLNKNAKDLKHREHVTNYIYENPKEFELAKLNMINFRNSLDLSSLKLSIDTPEDLERMEREYLVK